MGNALNKECVFCEIINGHQSVANSKKVLAANEKLLLFADIKPASTHHYLVIPREHIINIKSLQGEEHITLVQEMYQFGSNYLKSVVGSDLDDDSALYGFHLPPFISVHHLHLHVIYPTSKVSFVGSSLFRKGSWYFVSPEALVEQLKLKMKLG